MTQPQVRILIVEDDRIDSLACRRALNTMAGYAFVIIEEDTARGALQQVYTQMPDLILLDHHLPDMDGIEFLAELAADTGEVVVPVIMLTGAQDIAIAVDAMRRGARDYLVKDTEREYLKLLPTVIQRVLREGQAIADKRAAEAKYRAVVEQIPAIIYTAALDAPGNLLYISPQIRQLGFSAEEWLASPEGVLNQIHADDRAQVAAAYARSFESDEPLRCEYRLLTRKGAPRWFLDEARVVFDETGNRLFLQGILIDITEDKLLQEELEQHRRRLEELVTRRTALLDKRTALLQDANTRLVNELAERARVEQALRDSEARFRLLLESAGEGIYGVDVEGRCTFINDAALRLLGYEREQALGLSAHELLHPCAPDGTLQSKDTCTLCAVLNGGESCQGAVELLQNRNRGIFPAEISTQSIWEHGKIVGAVVVFHDVTEAEAMKQQLFYQVTHDSLTGLVNRKEFEWRLTRLLENARGESAEHALCFLDLDRFKIVNDTCGHAAGDELLRQLSGVLQKKLRQRDTLARLGGDEFGVLLEHCPQQTALCIAGELLKAVQEFQFHWCDTSFSIGISIGVAPLTEKTESPATALSAADAACYLAKEKGRNSVHLYPLVTSKTVER